MKQAFDYAVLSDRQSFNTALRHFTGTLQLDDAVQKGMPLGNLLRQLFQEGKIEQDQIVSILNALYITKYKAYHVSANLPSSFHDFDHLADLIANWDKVDIVLAYYHPTMGVLVFNPKNKSHFSIIDELRGDELVVLYVYSKEGPTLQREAGEILLKWLLHEAPLQKSENHARFQTPQSSAEQQRPSPKEESKDPTVKEIGQKSRTTPKYGVQVSNELFHNGNVEAWKNIIESYETAFPGNKVHVFYEGEHITDLNALFKWGKVKHQGIIFFQVTGPNIKKISKLQKYLYEGASPRFEVFMKKDINKVLNLF